MSQSTSVSAAVTPLDRSPLASRFRRRRAIPIVPTVRRVEGGFRVGSEHRDMCYLVTEVDGQATCTCPDFLLHEEEVDFQCKHVLAVEMAQRQSAIPSAAPDEGVGAMSSLHRYWPREAGADSPDEKYARLFLGNFCCRTRFGIGVKGVGAVGGTHEKDFWRPHAAATEFGSRLKTPIYKELGYGY